MSNALFPSHSLIGLAWPVLREPMFDTIVNRSASGMESRIALYSSSLSKWTLPFNYLSQDVGSVMPWSAADLKTLMGFNNQRFGMWDSFLFDDPTDDVNIGGPAYNTNTFAPGGDGTTTTFQLQRSYGGSIDPVYNINSGGVNSLSLTAGGSLYTFAYLTFGGAGTGAAGYAVVSGGAVASVVLTSAGVGYSGSVPVTVHGDGSGATVTASLTPKVYYNGTLLPSGVLPTYVIGSTGIITFNFAPSPGALITADCAFFWRVRMDSDSIEYSNDYASIWSAKKIVLYQTRN
jgi:hypothetical protein